MIERYYDEELRYLYDAGKDFARAHPERARYLNIDAVGDRDPYVERLFEGFAFLAARVREKLDDSFPQLTEGLINLMWPAFLETVPSCTIVQFQPRSGMLQETKTLPRGSELLSGAVGSEKCVCRFTTVFALPVHPMVMSGFERSTDRHGRETLSLRFTVDRGVLPASLKLDPLRFFIRAEPAVAQMIHYYLSRQVVEAGIYSGEGACLRKLDPRSAVLPAGGDPGDSLVSDEGALSGYRRLIEYFVCPEKFLFLDFCGMENAAAFLDERTTFEYRVTLGTQFPPGCPFDAGSLRLYCSPGVNLFRQEFEPMVFDGTRGERALVADTSYPSSLHVARVDSIIGIDRVSGAHRPFYPFFRHDAARDGDSGSYAVRFHRHFDGRRRVVISLGNRGDTPESSIRSETVTARGLGSNGTLPREELGEGDISTPGRSFPELYSFTNITRPTLPCPPPERDDYLWTVLSHLSASLFSLADTHVLRSLLLQYEWTGLDSRRRIIQSITSVSTRPLDQIFEGTVVRGVEVSIELGQGGVSDEGEMHLFGEALQGYLRHFVTINSFLRLVLIRMPEGMRMEWDSLKGSRWLV